MQKPLNSTCPMYSSEMQISISNRTIPFASSGAIKSMRPKVSIQGEVLRPGTYPLSKDMTAAQLVRMAGGFKRDALLESADLTSYGISRRKSNRRKTRDGSDRGSGQWNRSEARMLRSNQETF